MRLGGVKSMYSTGVLVAMVSMLASEPAAAPLTPEYAEEPTLEELFVEALEPRYVAPNRRDRIGRVWAPVTINGQGPFRLVLDTGANGSAVIASVVRRLGLSLDAAPQVQLHGVTGSAMVPAIEVDSLEVGELALQGRRLPVLPDAFGGAEGVLGTEGLLDKRISIDFTRDEISIMRSRRQSIGAGYTEIPLTLTRQNLLELEVYIGNLRVKAVLDTGAQTSVGNHALRDLLRRRPMDGGLERDITGVTLDVARARLLPIPLMRIGALEVRGLHLTFGEMAIFERWQYQDEPLLLLGMDVIGSFDALVIDYPRRQLHVRARWRG